MKRRIGMKAEFALVMLMLHFQPRFQAEPRISTDFSRIMGKALTSLESFVLREKPKLSAQKP
ncbi:MAG: hypothetical protein ABJH01_14745 [Algoriphagus sp.]|uniref:hypothetical protein n=1 Tax=Algoriphagus sp. TaxID=1872435 RepID=UPI003299B4F0